MLRFWPACCIVFQFLKAYAVSGKNISVTKRLPALDEAQNCLALSALLNDLSIFLVALASLVTSNVFAIALPTLPTFIAVLPATKGLAPPNVTASNPNNANSSTATEPIIPTVYAEFNNKLFANAPKPSLLDIPISIASSNSPAVVRSGPK